MRHPTPSALGLTLAVGMLAACAPSPSPRAPGSVSSTIIDLRRDRAVTASALVADLGDARAIYLGEHHDRAEDHALQARLTAALAELGPVAIGLEMVQRPFQAALDEYVAGDLDEESLLARIEWDDRWGFDFGFYRPIFELARERGLPLVALNARAELTRVVGREGLDALGPEMRETVPELDLQQAAHREMVLGALGGHPGMTDEMLENMYAAQVIWDETMADSAARALAAEGAPPRIVVLAGDFHVRGALGIPSRAARRGLEPYRVVLPFRADEMDEVRAIEPRVADYVWVVAPEE